MTIGSPETLAPTEVKIMADGLAKAEVKTTTGGRSSPAQRGPGVKTHGLGMGSKPTMELGSSSRHRLKKRQTDPPRNGVGTALGAKSALSRSA